MRRDCEIEQQVLRSFTLALAMTAKEICVESNNGVVTLSGTAQNRRDRSVIYSAACLASGVRRVVNNIEIKKDGKSIFAEAFVATVPNSAHQVRTFTRPDSIS